MDDNDNENPSTDEIDVDNVANVSPDWPHTAYFSESDSPTMPAYDPNFYSSFVPMSSSAFPASHVSPNYPFNNYDVNENFGNNNVESLITMFDLLYDCDYFSLF
jgi:hypothetical protein